MKTLIRVIRIVIVTAVTFGVALASVPAAAESTLNKVLERNKLIVGTTYDSPPTGYLDAKGHVVGYAADVARYMAKRLGVGLKFVQITSSTRIPLLQTKRIDVEIAITTPQKVRDEVVDFTYSYIWDSGVLLVPPGSSLNPDDYRKPDKIIGGTQGNGFVTLWKKSYPDAKFKLFREDSSGVTALKNGKVDAYLVNYFTASRYAKAAGLAVSKPWQRSNDALMVRENDSNWRDWLNWTLQRMFADNVLQKLYKKWYGAEPNFHMGDNSKLQQRIQIIGKKDDPWKPLPNGFIKKLLGDKSYTIK